MKTSVTQALGRTIQATLKAGHWIDQTSFRAHNFQLDFTISIAPRKVGENFLENVA